MYDLQHWLFFFSAAFAINISPGPDVVYIVSNTLAQGRRIGFASSFGVCAGALVHVLAAAVGISAILVTSATAFTIVKWAGAGYLIYLGIKTLASAGQAFALKSDKFPRLSFFLAFRRGMMIDILNPKVAVFFMAFLPQFVDPALGFVPAQLVLLGVLVIAVAIMVEAVYVLGSSSLTTSLRRNPGIGRWLDRLLGGVLIGLGLRLAFQERV